MIDRSGAEVVGVLHWFMVYSKYVAARWRMEIALVVLYVATDLPRNVSSKGILDSPIRW